MPAWQLQNGSEEGTESGNERITRGCIARNRVLAWEKFLNTLDRCKKFLLNSTFTIIVGSY